MITALTVLGLGIGGLAAAGLARTVIGVALDSRFPRRVRRVGGWLGSLIGGLGMAAMLIL